MEISEERRQAERNMLEASKRSYDNLKEPYRVGFVQMLQELIAQV